VSTILSKVFAAVFLFVLAVGCTSAATTTVAHKVGSSPFAYPVGLPQGLSQTAWFFDFANVTGCASDANLGTIGTCSGGNGPLLTIGQAYNRLGGHYPTFAGGSTVVFRVLSSQPSGSATSDPWGVFAPNTPNGMFELVGSFLPSGSTFAAGAVTQIVRSAAGNDFKVNVSAATSPAAGMLLYDSTVAGGSYAWIDSIAAGVATCTQPMGAAGLTTPINSTSAAITVDGASWTVGDTLQLYTVPTIYADLIDSRQGTVASTGTTAGATWIQSINFGDPSGAGSSIVTIRISGYLIASLVRSDAYLQVDAPESSINNQPIVANNWMSAGVDVRGYARVYGGAAATVHSADNDFHDFVLLEDDLILHSTTIISGGSVSAYNIHFPTSAALIVEPNASVVMRAGVANGSIWGPITVAVYQNAALVNRTGGTWANNMLVTTLQLTSSGTTTGSAYNDPTAGLWTNGISLTSANIDTWGGLQDPISGARFTN
jgi:hypothetical protein